MIRCYPEQDDYKRATIDLMSSAPTILSLPDLFSFLDSLQQTTDVMKLSHQEALNHNHVGGSVGGKKEKLINENTVIRDRDASHPLVAASPSSPSTEQKCRACDKPWSPSHREVCPAKDKQCCDCGRKGHFAGSEYCPLKQQNSSTTTPPPPPSALKKSPKAGPTASEEDKKKAARERRISAAIKTLEEEDPAALSVSLPSPPSNTYQHQGQGYSSAHLMLPTPYYSSLAPPPPTYRPTEEEKRVVRFDPRGPDPNAPSFPAFFRRPAGMLASLPPPPLIDSSERGGIILGHFLEDSTQSPWEKSLASPRVDSRERGNASLSHRDLCRGVLFSANTLLASSRSSYGIERSTVFLSNGPSNHSLRRID